MGAGHDHGATLVGSAAGRHRQRLMGALALTHLYQRRQILTHRGAGPL